MEWTPLPRRGILVPGIWKGPCSKKAPPKPAAHDASAGRHTPPSRLVSVLSLTRSLDASFAEAAAVRGNDNAKSMRARAKRFEPALRRFSGFLPSDGLRNLNAQ